MNMLHSGADVLVNLDRIAAVFPSKNLDKNPISSDRVLDLSLGTKRTAVLLDTGLIVYVDLSMRTILNRLREKQPKNTKPVKRREYGD